MDSLSIWIGVVAIIVSLLAVIVIFLTRNNIKDIIDKDVILFEGNFNTKKDAIVESFNLIDHVASFGKQPNNATFIEKSKQCYNNLLCVLSNANIAQEFYKLTIDQFYMPNSYDILNYKAMCRNDIGFKTKKIKVVNKNTNMRPNVAPYQPTTPAKPPIEQPSQVTNSINLKQSEPVRRPVARPTQPIKQPANTEVKRTTKAHNGN